MTVEYDLVVIGGGSAGLVVASAAAQLKAKVALVEKHRLGGDCLWFGCVPSKSLIQASRIAYQVKHSDRFGIYTQPPEIDFPKTIDYVQDVIKAIEPNDSPERFRGLGVNVIFGEGQFIDPKTFSVNEQKLTARAFVIATGSRAKIPAIEGLEDAGYLTNEQVFTLSKQPKSLAIIGTGPIGCELGQAFQRLGSQVTIIGSQENLLSKEDPEVAQVVEQQFIQEGIKIFKNAKIEKVSLNNGKKCLWIGHQIIADEILVAAGRTPSIESLNLEAANVQFNQKGIEVNSKLQTTNPKIYACGDVIGGYQFTHVAGYEASIVIQNALFFPFKKTNYRVIPWTTFTDPEVARVGLTEQQAREQYGDDLVILKQDFYHVDRAQAENATQGFAKIITRNNGEILGGHLVGASAGELIHEIVLAMTHKLSVSALGGIHVYPTLSEVNSKAALLLTKQKYAKNQTLQNSLVRLFSVLRKWSF